ncbi:hypothetical protein FBU30_004332 [Linnemannia zychae]|nr:hypothetical protein FBU30_004332 [Linnemannia zychae]
MTSLTSPNFSALSSAPTHTSSRISALGSIDVDKVRQMLGQIQLDNMSQGAKDLMRTMEMQALAHRTLASPSATTAEHMLHSPVTSPHPSFAHSIIPSMPSQPYDTRAAITLPSESIEAGKSTVASAVSNASTNSTLFVTKAELEMMEIRIMDKIEQRFQEMEDRIVNKLMLAKQSNYITNE